MTSASVYPSKYVTAAELGDKNVTLTIERVTMEDMPGDKNEQRPVVYFKGAKKGFVCNKTNWTAITKATSKEDSDDWPGHAITLFAATVDFKGVPTLAIRVSLIKPKVAPAKVPAKAPEPPPVQSEPGEIDEDNVPF